MARIIQSENPLYPRVKVTDAADRAAQGQVNVDLDALHELLRDDLGLEKEVTPKFVLYGQRDNSNILGLHIPYTHTAFVNLHSSESRSSASSTLIHEATHLVDSVEHPLRTAGELALRWIAHKGSMLGGTLASRSIPGPLITDTLAHAFTYYNLRMGLYYRHLDPGENRARASQNNEHLARKYRRIITVGERNWRLPMI